MQRSTNRPKRQYFELQKGIATIKSLAIPFRDHANRLRAGFDQRSGHAAAGLRPEVGWLRANLPREGCWGSWNRRELQRAVAALREHGITIDDESLAHLSPIDWEHINLTGDYTWQATGRLRKGAFRLLRYCLRTDDTWRQERRKRVLCLTGPLARLAKPHHHVRSDIKLLLRPFAASNE